MIKLSLAGAIALALSMSTAGAVTFNVVAKTGDVAPGTGGLTYRDFRGVALNNAGETAFSARLVGEGVTSANFEGIFTSSALVARLGDVAPGTGGALYRNLSPARLNDAGETAFRAFLTGKGVTNVNDSGIFTSTALVAREGDRAPGPGVRIFTRVFPPAINNAGELAFSAETFPKRVVSANGIGLTEIGVFKSAALVAKTGDAAPGTGGATYRNFSSPALNDVGEMAFTASLTGAAVNNRNDRGIFTSSKLVAREGDLAPGTGGANYESLGAPALNNSGETAFAASLTGAGVNSRNDQGIFTSSSLIARKRDIAPGTGGATFASLPGASLNDAGETAFRAVLTGAGVTRANSSGLFFSDSDGRLGLITRVGDVFDLGGGDLRTSTFISSASGLTNEGMLAFAVTFTDRTQAIFTVDTSAIPTFDRQPSAIIPLPAPAVLLLTGLAGLGLVARRRRPARG